MHCFITGTDTGIGKTVVTAALLRGLAARGLRAAGMKPLAAGATRDGAELVNEDAELLRACSSVALSRPLVCPALYLAPTAPHIAARAEGRTIELDPIVDAYAEIRRRADVVLVEGIGGWALPLGPATMLSDMVTRLDLPVLLVVGVRLGALNHALLSARAIAADGARMVGWVANIVDPDYAYAQDTVQALIERLPAPCVGRLDWQPGAAPDTISHSLSQAVDLMAGTG